MAGRGGVNLGKVASARSAPTSLNCRWSTTPLARQLSNPCTKTWMSTL